MEFFQTSGRNLLAADGNEVRLSSALIQPIISDDVAEAGGGAVGAMQVRRPVVQ